MNYCILNTLLLLYFSTLSVDAKRIISIKYTPDDSINKNTKRDLSLSYTATNIDSKEGTRVKTFTVIKNVGNIGKNNAAGAGTEAELQKQLEINPKLNKDEEWAKVFRENFESFGVLPDVPDVDDLFEFVNRKKPITAKDAEKHETTTSSKGKEIPKEKEMPQPEATTKSIVHAKEADAKATTDNDDDDDEEGPVEKIKGDAELLPHTKQKNILRMQALDDKKLRTRESLINVNYSTPLHSVHQYFDNYVQEIPNGYDYTKPACPCPPGSIPVTTPSGRKYDIPLGNSSGTRGGNPYIAPAINRKTPNPTLNNNIPQNAQPATPLQPNYSSVNSILPPLQQQPPTSSLLPPINQQANRSVVGTLPASAQAPIAAGVPPQPLPVQPIQPQTPTQLPVGVPVVGGGVAAAQPQPQPGVVGYAPTSQRPYVAPSLRNGLGLSRGPTQPPGLQQNNGGVPDFRTNIFGGAANRPHTFRSRGLKY